MLVSFLFLIYSSAKLEAKTIQIQYQYVEKNTIPTKLQETIIKNIQEEKAQGNIDYYIVFEKKQNNWIIPIVVVTKNIMLLLLY